MYNTTLIYQDLLNIVFRIHESQLIKSCYLFLPVYSISIEGDLDREDETFTVKVDDIKIVYPYETMKCSTITIMNNLDKNTYGPIDIVVEKI